MKKLFLLAIAAAVGIAANAQTRQMAVLNHDGEYSTFYGETSLQKAIDAASDGDKITLAPGFYNDITVTKSITIIGAGMSGNANETTRINSVIIDPRENASETEPAKYRVENLVISDRLHLNGGIVTDIAKCKIGNITGNPEIANITNCDITNVGQLYSWNPQHNNMTNSVITTEYFGYGPYPNFVNCIFTKRVPERGVFKDCIIIEGGQWAINAECSVSGCKYIGDAEDFFRFVGYDGNESAPADAQVFTADGFYELTPEYAAKWLGKDGSQAGIYGGPAPFTTTPSNPFISKFNIAHETTDDGKLSIDIEITAPSK